jgi:formylglycine-generating enzyme required for sulfatase activity
VALQAQFDTRVKADVEDPYRKGLADLNARYKQALDQAFQDAQKAGILKEALALKAEHDRLAKDASVPKEDTAEVPDSIKRLRAAYRQSHDKLLIQKNEGFSRLRNIYLSELEKMVAELTKQGDLKSAQEIQTQIDKWQNVGDGAPVPATVVAAPRIGNVPAIQNTDPSRATKDQPFVNSLGMKFVPVPGTDVLFCIHETRYKDFEAYAKENPDLDPRWKNQRHNNFSITDRPEDHPVTNVSWDDVKAYCAWLSKKEGKTYRLPTDREWSIAVGIGREEKWDSDTTPATVFQPQNQFPWGGQWPPPKGAGNYSDESRKSRAPGDGQYIDGYDDGFPTTAPVMSFDANRLGIFDLGGNLWEWCEDWYSSEKTTRVLRGASWFYARSVSAHRYSADPDRALNTYGFRVVLNPTAAPPAVSPPARPSGPDPVLARATKDAPFVNSLGMKFVPVPGTDVLFCVHETRHRDYATYSDQVLGVNAEWKKQTIEGFVLTERPEDHPVISVNWADAVKFCAWLSEKEGKSYRLPLDREWSSAVGIGREEDWKTGTTPSSVFKNKKEYPWGDRWPPPKGAGNFSDESRHAKVPGNDARWINGYDDGYPTTAPVMSFEPNRLGLFDLGGNVWELVHEWYDGTKTERVMRGCSWSYYGTETYLSSFRYHNKAESRYNMTGFRVVAEVNPGGSAR